MRAAVGVLGALLFAAIVAVAAFFGSVAAEGPACPPCHPPDLCPAVACVVNVSHAGTIAVLAGAGGLVLALLVLRPWRRRHHDPG
jgi:hypothetical protein